MPARTSANPHRGRPRRSRTLGQPGRYNSYRAGAVPLRPIPRRASRDFARRWLRQGFLIGLLIYAQLLFFFSSPLQARTIWVAGNRRITWDQIVRRTGLKPGDHLWAHSPHQVSAEVERLHELKDVHVSYGLPGRVEIQVTERQPLFQVSTNQKRPRWFAVDNEGVVLHPTRTLDLSLPRLLLDLPLQPNQRIHLSNLYLVSAAAAKIEHNLPGKVWYYRLDARGGLSFRSFSHHRKLDVQVGGLDNLAHKIAILKAILDGLTTGQEIASIDLRYSSPTVRYLAPPAAPVQPKTIKPS